MGKAFVTQRYLVFVSAAAQTCGVEAFSRLLAGALGAKSAVLGAGPRSLMHALRAVDAVVFNFPVVAWKRKLFAPALSALLARLMGRDVVTVLHEWLALDWKRRWVLTPVVVLSNRLVFSAPEIADEFASVGLSKWASADRVVIPIPPNIAQAVAPRETENSRALQRAREGGRLIIGQFGSIYPKKQSGRVLEVAAHLLAAGHDVGVVFAGSFIKGMDDVEEAFDAQVEAVGLRDRVLVTGFVAGDDELAGLFAEIDVFCYAFAEGLTARRGSVLAAALSGKPVVVNAPERPDALSHHRLFERLIAAGRIRLVPVDADVATLAAEVLAARSTDIGGLAAEEEVALLWQDIATRFGRSVPLGKIPNIGGEGH